jgi:hypothetical protein
MLAPSRNGTESRRELHVAPVNSMTRRHFWNTLTAGLLAPTLSLAKKQCATFGAIRWDAQYCDVKGEPCHEEERALSPPRWRFRAPLHSIVTGAGTIQFTATQDSFDREIQVASQAGLGYWVYLAYGKDGKLDFNHSMMRGLDFHRRSKIAYRMDYSLATTLDTLGRAGAFDDAIKRVCDLFGDRNYLRTTDRRPVLFLYYLEGLLPAFWKGSLAELAKAVLSLRKRATDSGHENPFVVLLHGPPSAAEIVRAEIGADALSTYAINLGPNRSASYSTFEQYVEQYWREELDRSSAAIVPTVMVGWDSRPRKENPPAYDKRDYGRIDRSAHIDIASPDEFALACKRADRFILDHPDRCPYGLVLIYSWNEYSEGGALAPTLGDPSSSLLAGAAEFLNACRR